MALPGGRLLRSVVSSATASLWDGTRTRVRRFEGRLHIAVRGLSHGELPHASAARLAEEVERRLTGVPGVTWAVANTVLGHAVVGTDDSFDPEELVPALIDVVEELEEAHGLEHPLPDHPASGRTTRRASLAVAVQVAAAPLAAVTGLARRAPLPSSVTALIPLVDVHPRLRAVVDRAIGTDNANVLLPLLGAVGHAGSGGVVGVVVDTVRHTLRVLEANAEAAAWAAAEPRLAGSPTTGSHGPVPAPPPRETPLRPGAVERYADQAVLVAAASFAGSLLVTRRPARAAGGALAAIPKAPLLAREGFACALGRGLARRGVLVADSGALRRLDRIGTVLLDTGVLATGSHVLADLVPLDDDAPVGDLAARAHRLFDGSAPGKPARDGEWALGPVEHLSVQGRTGARERERMHRDGARLVLGLAHGRRLLAVISAVPQMHDAAGAFVPAAHAAGLRVVVAGAHTADPAVREAHAVRAADERLVDCVRDLQRDGEGVLLISRDRAALSAADVGVGVVGPEGSPPWGAHLYVDAAAAAVVIVRACRGARDSARRGVRIAEAAAAVGATAALAGRSGRPAARGVTAFNAAGALATCTGVWSAVRVLRRPSPVTAASRRPWHAMDPGTVLERTGSAEAGLTDEEAQARGTAPGERAPTSSPVRAYLTEMANPLTPVLGAGAAMSASVGAVLDAVVIVAVTAVSGLVGGFQRYRTDRAVARLRRESGVMARVLRDERETTVPAHKLVVGDVVVLSAGDVVPADARLLEAHHLETDESALTGESLPVAKAVAPVLASDVAERTSMVYEGTTVAAGRCRAVVVATGTETEASRAAVLGRGAAMPAVGVERRLARITRGTLPVALGSAAAVMVAGTLRGRSTRETVGAGVGLAVASVPEGLPFLVSAAQLASARRLSARGALVRDPRTIEAAGRTDVLCFDKTGTLTHGRISLVAVSADGESRSLESLGDEQRAVLAAALRATPHPHGGAGFEHATDGAVTAGAHEAGVRRTTDVPGWRRVSGLPFEPSRGFHATMGRIGERRILSVKGAPEEVVERCATRGGRPLDERERADVLSAGEKLAAEGHRILAVAELREAAGEELRDETVRGLDFVGFLAFADRVRGTAAEAVRHLVESGVHIVMITGDHPGTAGAMASELGVLDGRRVVTGTELDDLDDRALDALLPDVGVVARGTPVHKVRVVQAFQRLGRTVAMTGDGANDAPAIRLADVGIAFGTRATPAARAAADLVVTDDRLETVLAALVEGRAMWASVRQALAILVGGNLGEIAFTLLGAAATGTSPLTARQLLLVNLFTDLAPAMAVALRPPRPEAAERMLHEGPEVSLGTALTEETVCRAVATALGATAAWIVARFTGRAVRARTVALVALVGTQLGQTLLAGGRSGAIVGSSLGSLAALAAVVQTPVLSQFFGCTPLGPFAWGIALSTAAAATVSSLFLPPLVGRIRAALPRPLPAVAGA
ncbi:cation-transporting P-type ATPase [Streptomyces sp. Ru72]|uniref:cation-translocating P-type ATPase n=1 Tax=Streptomyces sp. Ru72 TaxID=2080747 RepID=UPI000CDE2A7A|nr:cation-transporting P-type ATPase [Streptomyces sp. Ru72]POX46940.1 hypothetical protein C3488_24915 [Streptomyces sp. Ru72]